MYADSRVSNTLQSGCDAVPFGVMDTLPSSTEVFFCSERWALRACTLENPPRDTDKLDILYNWYEKPYFVSFYLPLSSAVTPAVCFYFASGTLALRSMLTSCLYIFRETLHSLAAPRGNFVATGYEYVMFTNTVT